MRRRAAGKHGQPGQLVRSPSAENLCRLSCGRDLKADERYSNGCAPHRRELRAGYPRSSTRSRGGLQCSCPHAVLGCHPPQNVPREHILKRIWGLGYLAPMCSPHVTAEGAPEALFTLAAFWGKFSHSVLAVAPKKRSHSHVRNPMFN